jgi:hypothetical protein
MLSLLVVVLFAGSVWAASSCTVGSQKVNSLSNAVFCTGDTTGLRADVGVSFVASASKCTTAKKCEAYCKKDFGNCDNNIANGCEQGLTADANCGVCGKACSSLQTCKNKVCTCKVNAVANGIVDVNTCQITCNANYNLVNGQCVLRACAAGDWTARAWEACSVSAGKDCGTGTQSRTVNKKSGVACSGESGKPALTQSCQKACSAGKTCNAVQKCVAACTNNDWTAQQGVCSSAGKADCQGTQTVTYLKRAGSTCEGGAAKPADTTQVCTITSGYDYTCADSDGGENIFAPGTVTVNYKNCRAGRVMPAITTADRYQANFNGQRVLWEFSCLKAAGLAANQNELNGVTVFRAVNCDEESSGGFGGKGYTNYCTNCVGNKPTHALLCGNDIGVTQEVENRLDPNCLGDCTYTCESGYKLKDGLCREAGCYDNNRINDIITNLNEFWNSEEGLRVLNERINNIFDGYQASPCAGLR